MSEVNHLPPDRSEVNHLPPSQVKGQPPTPPQTGQRSTTYPPLLRSMGGRYASYWNAILLLKLLQTRMYSFRGCLSCHAGRPTMHTSHTMQVPCHACRLPIHLITRQTLNYEKVECYWQMIGLLHPKILTLFHSLTLRVNGP